MYCSSVSLSEVPEASANTTLADARAPGGSVASGAQPDNEESPDPDGGPLCFEKPDGTSLTVNSAAFRSPADGAGVAAGAVVVRCVGFGVAEALFVAAVDNALADGRVLAGAVPLAGLFPDDEGDGDADGDADSDATPEVLAVGEAVATAVGALVTCALLSLPEPHAVTPTPRANAIAAALMTRRTESLMIPPGPYPPPPVDTAANWPERASRPAV